MEQPNVVEGARPLTEITRLPCGVEVREGHGGGEVFIDTEIDGPHLAIEPVGVTVQKLTQVEAVPAAHALVYHFRVVGTELIQQRGVKLGE